TLIRLQACVVLLKPLSNAKFSRPTFKLVTSKFHRLESFDDPELPAQQKNI
ncbi:14179_t:CDS:1, partial [Racocetra persica]